LVELAAFLEALGPLSDLVRVSRARRLKVEKNKQPPAKTARRKDRQEKPPSAALRPLRLCTSK
jgi:hypothetical protein